MISDDRLPTPLLAGLILAKEDELVGHLHHITQGNQKQQTQADKKDTVE